MPFSFSVHAKEDTEDACQSAGNEMKHNVRGVEALSSVQVERLWLFLNLLGQVAGISPSGNHIIRRTIADDAGSSEVHGAPGGLLLTAHFVDVG